MNTVEDKLNFELKNDKLNRTRFLDKLFKLFSNFGDQSGHGLTIVINGKYGAGKSTLLSFINEKNAELIKDEKNTTEKRSEDKDNATYKSLEIVNYNAWKDNLYKEPLIPILKRISEIRSTGKKIKDGAKNVAKNIPSVVVSSLVNKIGVDTDKLFNKSNYFQEYDEYNDAVSKFKEVLGKYCEKKKTLFLVDELDRCLPEYQIKVLEVLHHLLDIPNLIIVIALDKAQLERAIKNKFGEDSDTSGYLAKFIDYEIELPNPENETKSYLESRLNFTSENEFGTAYAKNIITTSLFNIEEMSLRESLMLINEINLICNEKDDQGKPLRYYYWYPIILTMLLILKKRYSDIYKKYFGKSKVKQNGASEKLLEQTPFGEFLKDIKGTDFEKIISSLRSNNDSSTLLAFINTFLSITDINIEWLQSYVNLSNDIIRDAYFNKGVSGFPDMINKLIEKVEIVGI